MSAGSEVLDHTADVGIRSWGGSLEEAFEQAAWAMIDLLGIRIVGRATVRSVSATGRDEGALLVDFLNELLLLHETERAGFAGLRVIRIAEGHLQADTEVGPLPAPAEGVLVKAATLHQLRVEHRPDGGVEAWVYLDV